MVSESYKKFKLIFNEDDPFFQRSNYIKVENKPNGTQGGQYSAIDYCRCNIDIIFYEISKSNDSVHVSMIDHQ